MWNLDQSLRSDHNAVHLSILIGFCRRKAKVCWELQVPVQPAARRFDCLTGVRQPTQVQVDEQATIRSSAPRSIVDDRIAIWRESRSIRCGKPVCRC